MIYKIRINKINVHILLYDIRLYNMEENIDFEIMFINNVLDDKTIAIIEGIKQIKGRIKLITLNKKLGVQSQN